MTEAESSFLCMKKKRVCHSDIWRFFLNDSDSSHRLWLGSSHAVKSLTLVESSDYRFWGESSRFTKNRDSSHAITGLQHARFHKFIFIQWFWNHCYFSGYQVPRCDCHVTDFPATTKYRLLLFHESHSCDEGLILSVTLWGNEDSKTSCKCLELARADKPCNPQRHTRFHKFTFIKLSWSQCYFIIYQVILFACLVHYFPATILL